jgi:hypothetical protein
MAMERCCQLVSQKRVRAGVLPSSSVTSCRAGWCRCWHLKDVTELDGAETHGLLLIIKLHGSAHAEPIDDPHHDHDKQHDRQQSSYSLPIRPEGTTDKGASRRAAVRVEACVRCFDCARGATAVAVQSVAIIASLDASLHRAVSTEGSNSLHQTSQVNILGRKNPRACIEAAHRLQPPLALSDVPRPHIGHDVEPSSEQVQVVRKLDVAGCSSKRNSPVFALELLTQNRARYYYRLSLRFSV